MKTVYLLIFFISLLLITKTQSSFKLSTPAITLKRITVKKAKAENNGRGFAVLELFTSEGCSSCPPADELMAKIQKETEGKKIYILAYHVDYWDRLGWKDIYSSAEYSNRQEQYSKWLNVSPIYTPQVIVNGKSQFVGSEESAIRQAISEQLMNDPVTTLAIQAFPEGSQLKVSYHVAHASGDSRILIAIIEKAAQSKVERGENAGRILSHVQIVRKLETSRLTPAGEGNAVLSLANGFDTQNWEVLGLVQDQHTGEIMAVAKAGSAPK